MTTARCFSFLILPLIVRSLFTSALPTLNYQDASFIRRRAARPSPIKDGGEENFDLSKWRLQLPVYKSEDEKTSMKTIQPSELPSFHLDGIYERTETKIIMTVDVDGIKEKGTGVISKNSKYYRTEFRQTESAGASFDLSSPNTQTMELTFSVDKLDGSDTSVVVAQIHGEGPLPNLEVRVYKDGRIIAEDHQNKKGFLSPDSPTLTSEYTLGSTITLKIVAGNKKIDLFYNEETTPKTITNQAFPGQYFKAGNYCQSTKNGAVCQVSVYALTLD